MKKTQIADLRLFSILSFPMPKALTGIGGKGTFSVVVLSPFLLRDLPDTHHEVQIHYLRVRLGFHHR